MPSLSESNTSLLTKDRQPSAADTATPAPNQVSQDAGSFEWGSEEHLFSVEEQAEQDLIKQRFNSNAPANPCMWPGVWLTVLESATMELLIPVDATAASNVAWQETSPFGIIMPKQTFDQQLDDEFVTTMRDAHKFCEEIEMEDMGTISYAEAAVLRITVTLNELENNPKIFSDQLEQMHEELLFFLSQIGESAKLHKHVRAASMRFESG